MRVRSARARARGTGSAGGLAAGPAVRVGAPALAGLASVAASMLIWDEYPATVCADECSRTSAARPVTPSDEAHHPDPLFQRGGPAPGHAAAGCRAQIPGFDAVEWLIIDDGSTDRTIEVARERGVDHVVRLTNNKGLAPAFQAGLDAGLKLGADVIVNTDADNQYDGRDIPKLVAPILAGHADMVVGDRRTETIEHFSAAKKSLQRMGSWVVRQASSTEVPDVTSGFRAYNREAALQVQVVSSFTYTLETIIQAGKLLVALDHVPVRTNPKTRESRLFPSTSAYVRRNALSIFRIYSQYEPLKVFWGGAVLFALGAFALFVRFLIVYIEHPNISPATRNR